MQLCIEHQDTARATVFDTPVVAVVTIWAQLFPAIVHFGSAKASFDVHVACVRPQPHSLARHCRAGRVHARSCFVLLIPRRPCRHGCGWSLQRLCSQRALMPTPWCTNAGRLAVHQTSKANVVRMAACPPGQAWMRPWLARHQLSRVLTSWPILRRFRMPSGLATAGDLAARIAEEFSLNVRGAEELQLIMDGFAVLPGSAADVIRDGDLVKVQRAPAQRSAPRAQAHAISKPAGGTAAKPGAASEPQQAAGAQQPSRKRKAAAPAQQQPRPAKKPATAAAATAAPESSSSDESSSEEEASSSDQSTDDAASSSGMLQLQLLTGTVRSARSCCDAEPKTTLISCLVVGYRGGGGGWTGGSCGGTAPSSHAGAQGAQQKRAQEEAEAAAAARGPAARRTSTHGR